MDRGARNDYADYICDKEMLAVTGYRSTIVDELRTLLLEDEEVVRMADYIPDDAERYLLCAGVIRPKTLREQTAEEIRETIEVNLITPIRLCDAILERNPKARICVIGSESGFSWSYDGVYASAKAALHRYVETKKLEPLQQLVCLAPSVINFTGMTLARPDVENLAARESAHPKRRFLTPMEVAKAIHFLLYQDLGYITGTVIRVNGGGR
jgi:NAD(P)-dependent dehydrogenase (short-subunit alcohol dehydrogenase family)